MSNTTALVPPLDVQTLREDAVPPAIEVAGLQADNDLPISRPPSPVVLRRAIANAQDFDQLRMAARGLRTTAVSLHNAQAGPIKAAWQHQQDRPRLCLAKSALRAMWPDPARSRRRSPCRSQDPA